MIMLELIARIFFAHAIADYALQNNRLNRWKNVNEAIPVIEKPTWVFALTAHAMTNGAVLYLMTGNIIMYTRLLKGLKGRSLGCRMMTRRNAIMTPVSLLIR